MRRQTAARTLFSLLLAQLLPVAAASAQEAMDCVMNPRATIELGSHQDGVLEAVLVEPGDTVKQGQAVARLDSELEVINAELSRLRAESDILVRSSETQSKFRAKEHQRLESLRSKKSVSDSVYDQADIERRLAELAVDSAELDHQIARAEHQRARAQLERRTIKSPADGVVVNVVMSRGEYVHEQSTLMVIAEIDPLYVEVYVPVAAFGKITDGMSARIRPEEPIGGEHRAAVKQVDRVFDAASRTFGVRLELPNPDFALPAGVRCTVVFDSLE